MPWGEIKLVPGMNAERTPTLLEAGYTAGNLIRFRDGLAEKLGGFQKFYPFSVSGIPRALHAWADLNFASHLGLGTTTQLGQLTSGTLLDITPQTKTVSTQTFQTTAGSPVVSVVDAGISNVTTFDSIFFNTPVSIGGLLLYGLYPITSSGVGGATHYTIQAATNAPSSAGPGGTVPVFTTVNGSATINVQINNHGIVQSQLPGPQVVFPISTTGNGVTINGVYTVANVVDANNIQIFASNQANASSSFSMNAGNSQLVYYINLGPLPPGVPYGTGLYGAGAYGLGVVPAAQTGTPITAIDWTMGNWGQLLISCPTGGGIYQYDPTGGFLNAALVPNAPIFNTGIFITMPARQIMAFGSTLTPGIGILRDPMEIAWCDVDNISQWTASSSNQAGKYRLSPGSMVVAGRQASNYGVLWTDLDVWTVPYLGAPLVYGFNKIDGGSGCVSLRAHCELSGNVFWMGQTNFYVLAGNAAAVLPCTVWDIVFQNIDRNNLSKCWAWANTPFNEVWFFWPSSSGALGECDSYAKFNTIERTWDAQVGSLGRSCGINQSVLGMPIAASRQGFVYQHETTLDADGAPMSWSFTTGNFMIGEGEEFFVIDVLIPDFRFGLRNGSTQNASIQIAPTVATDPNDPGTTYGPYTFNAQTTEVTDLRMRGRLCSFAISGNDVGTFARLGRIRYRYAPDGKWG